MIKLIAIVGGAGFLIWAWYQWKNKRVWAHTGWTRFSSIEWISKDDSPARFWLTVISQAIAGILMLAVGLGIIKPEGI